MTSGRTFEKDDATNGWDEFLTRLEKDRLSHRINSHRKASLDFPSRSQDKTIDYSRLSAATFSSGFCPAPGFPLHKSSDRFLQKKILLPTCLSSLNSYHNSSSLLANPTLLNLHINVSCCRQDYRSYWLELLSSTESIELNGKCFFSIKLRVDLRF